MSIPLARELRLAGRYLESVELLASLPNQSSIEVLRELLFNYFNLRKIDELIAVTGSIQAVDPTYGVEALAHCGLLLRALGNRNAAVDYFRAALVANAGEQAGLPDWFHSEFAGVLIDQQNWTEALEVATAGVAVKPALNLAIAHIQIRLGDFKAAHDSLSKAAHLRSGDPAKSNSFLSLATELWIHDGREEVRQWICTTPISISGEHELHLAKADSAAAAGNHKAAAAIWLKVASEHKSLQQFIMRSIAEVVRGRPELLNEFCSVYEGLLVLDPTTPAAVFAFYEYLTVMMSHQDAITRMLSFQTRMLRLLPALVVELVRWGLEQKIHELLPRQIDAWQRSIQYIRCSRFFEAICRLRPVGTDLLESARSFPHCIWQTFLLFRLPSLKTVSVWATTESELTLLSDAGVKVLALREYMDAMTRLLPGYEAYLEAAKVACADVRKKIRDDECFVAFQDRAVRDGKFSMIDPFTGNNAALLDSVKIYDRQIFSFTGSELIMAISGGNMNALAFMYLPSIHVLIPVESLNSKCSQSYYGSTIHMADILAVYLTRAAVRFDEFLIASIKAPQREGSRRKVIAIHGRAENPAHHSWNYLSPFARLNIEGILGNVDCIVRPPTEYFGDVRQIFPELSNVEMLDLPERPAIDPMPFSVDHLVIQLGGNFITYGLKKRLQAWASSQISTEQRSGIEAPSGPSRPIIWLGLRVGDKVWINQEVGLISVINTVVSQYPGVIFLLDGFSVSNVGERVPAKWLPAFQELRDIAGRIKRSVTDPEAVIDLIGGTLAEALVWAGHASMYFTPMGSSQHKIGWYSECPGIVYTSTKYASTRMELLPGAWESEGSTVPEYLFGNIASAGRRRNHFDFRSNLENIDLTVADVADRILKLLGKQSGTG